MQDTGHKNGLEHRKLGFREYIPSRDLKRGKELTASNTYEWCDLRCAEPFVIGWKKIWEELYSEPYKGITVDGTVIPDLYPLADGTSDHRAPAEAMMKAAQHVLEVATVDEREALHQPVDAPEWRRWSNPEIYIYRLGVRLEEVSEQLVTAIHEVIRASLSPAGYVKARGCMKVNQFLGEVVDGKSVLNERSYNFSIYGTPSETIPWGWQLYGHHFCMNCFVVGTQMVISPVFMGAEPNIIDEGPDKGTELFTDQERVALGLMQSMDKAKVEQVRIYKQLSGSEYPPGRFHRADQRHLGGAFQDNRVIPYEGLRVLNLPQPQQDMVYQLIVLSLNYLPKGAFETRMAEIFLHWKDTYFCWIGSFQDQDAFYYKVHSPVVMIEFDHHTGVFLNNKVPLPFHIHTLVRTPNGNDYGKALLKQWQQRSNGKKL
ncbi:hypothetical protein B0O99DRAFT_660484 [Bisporella sp. PMI_857]|nr:hypothetical protein B0O99DRAFT_660484 [Bisporella sp. PMI_857]